jgi:Uma2 family endonuclease
MVRRGVNVMVNGVLGMVVAVCVNVLLCNMLLWMKEDVVALPEFLHMNVEEYLFLDRNSPTARYEYLDGQLVMLAGGSTYHSAIIANLTTLLGRALEESACWIYNSDVRLKLSTQRYVYPDITVSCDPRDHELSDTIQFPCVVIEVLSPSTENIDRGKKFVFYRECATIQEYMMVDSLSMRIEIHHRGEDGWECRTFGPGSTVIIEHLDIRFPLQAVYRNIKLNATRNQDAPH